MADKEQLLVIGFGRLGEVLSRFLSEDYAVSVIDPSESRKNLALSQGYSVVSYEDARNFKTIYLAVPINKMESTVDAIKDKVTDDTLVIDTCSVKIYPTKLMNDKLRCSILGTHPLFGPDSVDGGLHNRPIVICSIKVSDSQLKAWTDFWEDKGAKIIISTPEKHDESIAYSLGLTHFVGRILGEINLKKMDMTTRGYDSLLEIIKNTNNDSWELFTDMQRYNPYTEDMRDKVYSAISKIEATLDKTIEDQTP